MATGNLGCVVVAVDSSAESMKALRWALDNLRLRPAAAAAAGDDASPAAADLGVLIILHVQSPLSIVTSLNPGFIPFGDPSDVDAPAFSAAIEAYQRRITGAILKHALDICADRNVNVRTEVVVGNPKVKICEATVNSHADLLVMGCRSMGPIKRMFLGSVKQPLHQPCELPSSCDKGNIISSFSTVFAVVVLAFELKSASTIDSH